MTRQTCAIIANVWIVGLIVTTHHHWPLAVMAGLWTALTLIETVTHA